MAHRIQELLDEHSYRPATFARKVGISQSTFAEILSGKRDFNNVGVSKILAIAKGFGVTPEYLSGESDARKYPGDVKDAALNELFDQLNDEGKERLLEIADDMVRSRKYQKTGENNTVSEVKSA